ncbi:ParA family protein [Streptomyces sp. LHD-70]|uniref:ParA family protein n=1 Tax=Streptomyces sp. LHD-70 TaxID=3072140 RepID=UPI00280D1152|nr:ParA family protein [Streptomyces sp. LHD-70]MDQ8707528.1 ParA family protein [Streptomyces sp. LHD-70]
MPFLVVPATVLVGVLYGVPKVGHRAACSGPAFHRRPTAPTGRLRSTHPRATRVTHLIILNVWLHEMPSTWREVMSVRLDVSQLNLVDLDAVKGALLRRLSLVQDNAIDRKVIVVINGKGGVGKSSLAAALAAALAQIGLKVLLGELDEQGNNAEDLGLSALGLADNGEAQAAAILDGKLLTPTGEARPNLHVLPGGLALEEVVEELYCQRRVARRFEGPFDRQVWMGLYAAAIERVRHLYDVIILDVAPGNAPLQLQALTGGELVLIPTKSDPSSRKGLRTVAQRFATAAELNPLLRLLGVAVFATNSSATRIQSEIREQLEGDLLGAAPVFEQTIRHVESAAVACRKAGKVPQELRNSKDLDRAAQRSMSQLAGDYQSLALEVMQVMRAMKDQEGRAA